MVGDDILKCPKCGGSNIRAWVGIYMYIDPDDLTKINKKTIAKKSTEIWSMVDAKPIIVCGDCCYSSDNKEGEEK